VQPLTKPSAYALSCRAETGISSQNIFFGLAAWASFMACTAADKLAVKPADSRKGKTVSAKVGGTGSTAQ
jgi:hypothetical protein